jgi:nicotinate phosphoribosyltransferase
MFHSADAKEIKAGMVTDAYFPRTLAVLQALKLDKRVRAEFIAKGLPNGWPWGVLAGIEECAELLSGIKVSVRCMKEGTVFRAYQPVMEIEGDYRAFGRYETSLLGFLCQASGVATKAARCKMAAGGRPVVSFGGRRVHPAVAPVVERSAFIGGCDGVALLKSAQLVGVEASGTMPHALILLVGDTLKATQAFHQVLGRRVKTISLIDTFNDEKFEAVRVAESLGSALYGVRLDTPASRRGDFLRILEEVRWELDMRGFRQVRLYVSGGLDEEDILRLNPLADGYGIGTSVSSARVVDFSMDIVEVEGKPLAKRGKSSGAKRVVRCRKCQTDRIIPCAQKTGRCACGGICDDLLLPLIEKGRLIAKLPSPRQIRASVLKALKNYTLAA